MEAAQLPDLVIRPLRGRELIAAHNISARSFDLPYTYETLMSYRQRARGGFLVAELSGKLAGFVIATSPVLSFLGNRTGEIAVLAVDEVYRRMGVGSRLLEDGLELLRSRGMRRARLHVETGNRGAIALYEAYGFERECVIRGYYRNGRDAYRMTVSLTEGA
jgi:ribosomal protein S18 acetylase RimI-like enzyme